MYLAPACTFWLLLGSMLLEWRTMVAEGALGLMVSWRWAWFLSCLLLVFPKNFFLSWRKVGWLPARRPLVKGMLRSCIQCVPLLLAWPANGGRERAGAHAESRLSLPSANLTARCCWNAGAPLLLQQPAACLPSCDTACKAAQPVCAVALVGSPCPSSSHPLVAPAPPTRLRRRSGPASLCWQRPWASWSTPWPTL